jgi:hypothetical protein
MLQYFRTSIYMSSVRGESNSGSFRLSLLYHYRDPSTKGYGPCGLKPQPKLYSHTRLKLLAHQQVLKNFR